MGCGNELPMNTVLFKKAKGHFSGPSFCNKECGESYDKEAARIAINETIHRINSHFNDDCQSVVENI